MVQAESLNHSTEIPQLGHQVGTRAVILKCDSTEQDHARRRKANKAPWRVISWTKGYYFSQVYWQNISFRHFGPKPALPASTQLPPALVGFDEHIRGQSLTLAWNECRYFMVKGF